MNHHSATPGPKDTQHEAAPGPRDGLEGAASGSCGSLEQKTAVSNGISRDKQAAAYTMLCNPRQVLQHRSGQLGSRGVDCVLEGGGEERERFQSNMQSLILKAKVLQVGCTAMLRPDILTQHLVLLLCGVCQIVLVCQQSTCLTNSMYNFSP